MKSLIIFVLFLFPIYANSQNKFESELLKYRGDELLAKGELDNALSAYKDVIKLDSTNDQCLYNIGWIYNTKNIYSTAIKYFDLAIKFNSKNYKYFAERGSSQMNINQYDKGIKDLTSAIYLNPSDQILYFNRAVSFPKTGPFKS